MSKYSELMGSFIRTGSFTLEANYIFASEEALLEFYSDEINAATLHAGLLKIVLDDGEGNQALYWAVAVSTEEEDGSTTTSYEFLKLITTADLSTLSETLESLTSKLEEHIEDSDTEHEALWGTSDPSVIDSELNSIYDLAKALVALQEALEEAKEEWDANLLEALLAVAGTEEEDVISYLQTLDYPSITVISEQLAYLTSNMVVTDTLTTAIEDLWLKIEGEPLPTTTFQTLRGVEDYVRALESTLTNAIANLLTELDQTQVGVGLSGDGSYNADLETNYLQDATSVMNALKTLDSLMAEALSGLELEVENEDVVDLEVEKGTDSWVISATLNISDATGNLIIKKSDGIFMNVVSTYEDGIFTLKVNDNVIALHLFTATFVGIQSASYDTDTECIYIVFELASGSTETLTIPVAALIREWEVDNSGASDVVVLTKTLSTTDTDKLSADVRISSATNNILEKDGNSLLVQGISDNITYNGTSLTTIIELFEELIAALEVDESLVKNLQEEVDNIETAVGLNADGSYSADTETTYINEATSVANALRTIDTILAELQEQIDGIGPYWNFVDESTDSGASDWIIVS